MSILEDLASIDLKSVYGPDCVFLKRPRGVNVIQFRESVVDSFLRANDLDNNSVSKVFDLKEFGRVIRLSDEKKAVSLIGQTFVWTVGKISHQITVVSVPNPKEHIRCVISNVPEKYCSDSKFRDFAEEFCKPCSTSSAASSTEDDEEDILIDSELEVDKFGKSNRGIIYVRYLPERVFRQGGRNGFCFDELANLCDPVHGVSFYFSDSSLYCKGCDKLGHDTPRCYVIQKKLCTIDEIKTPEGKRKQLNKSRSILLSTGEEIVIGPGMPIRRLHFNADSQAQSSPFKPSSKASTTSSSSTKINFDAKAFESYDKEMWEVIIPILSTEILLSINSLISGSESYSEKIARMYAKKNTNNFKKKFADFITTVRNCIDTFNSA
jgi:hypothetical protein